MSKSESLKRRPKRFMSSQLTYLHCIVAQLAQNALDLSKYLDETENTNDQKNGKEFKKMEIGICM